MITRRNFLQNSLFGAGALALSSSSQNLFAKSVNSGSTKTRFIFMTRSNGIRPHLLPPASFSKGLMDKENNKQPFSESLDKHELRKWMSVLESHKSNLAMVQGLSNTFAHGHRGNISCLGMFKGGTTPWATIDVELGKLNPSPFQHIEVLNADNSRGIVNGMAVLEKGKRNFAYADPLTAFSELFKTAAKDKNVHSQLKADALVLDYLQQNTAGQALAKSDTEIQKMNNFGSSIEDINRRNKILEGMSAQISHNMPALDNKYFQVDATKAERQNAYVEIVLGALKAGLTNSVLFTLDTLNDPYTGLPEQDKAPIHLHDIGHGKPYLGTDANKVREWIRMHHMRMINRLVEELKKTPEDNGSMFDNTVIMYQPDGGGSHHSKGIEHPVVVLAGKNTKMNFLGQYIRLPYYGKQGHKTLGNWYTTLLNNHGNSSPHFGQEDLKLRGMGISNQKGPIKEFLV